MWANSFSFSDYCVGYEMKHGKRRPNKSTYRHGEKVYYDCDEGYEKHDDHDYDNDYSMCKSDGMWDRKPPMCRSAYKSTFPSENSCSFTQNREKFI